MELNQSYTCIFSFRDELIAVDDGVEIVYELMEDVIGRASSIVFEHYIEAEVYPYAIQDVKTSILKIIAVTEVACSGS